MDTILEKEEVLDVKETKVVREKPRLTNAAIWNMSVGFFGIQTGFALQNGNASRILQIFGANVEHLPLFWLAAPLTGMIVQPIIGHMSDRTWNKLGRRRPFILFGALITTLALIFLPHSGGLASILPPLLMGAGMLMLMDTSINITMEPFRALVADNLPASQYSKGFAIQTCLIGIGALIGSWMPFFFAEYCNVSKTAPDGYVPDNVLYSFYVGAAILLVAILWTVFTTKEYPPEEVSVTSKDTQDEHKGAKGIWNDLKNMPKAMRELGWVQFFSWFALFSMWVFTTPAIAEHVYKVPSGDTSSAAYADAGNWVSFLFGIYNVVSAVYALFLPKIAERLGKKGAHALSLVIGGVSLVSIYFIVNPTMLIVPMIGIGIAWGSILSMPYSMLSASLPPKKMGIYMGLFNFFITLPQICNGILGGLIVKYFFHDKSIMAIVMAGAFLILGAIATMRVKEAKQK
ncbi:MAG: MFS transporter [Pseudopedobacter saltans]|uniref:MFS transporter n=1 Tax=Pseudopedobacter saltans TaxID=151895 RepID=A0A2W5F8G4_9SPHI|nr:MAG: MFS transporter [Pseudopedobacter saltans]